MTEPATARKYLPVAAVVVTVLVGLFFFIKMVQGFLAQEKPPTKQVVQEVRIIRPPPPPPDVKPPPPPPPEEKVDVPEPEPEMEPTPSNDPPPGDLGIDAVGEGSGDGFGLVGRPGGRDLLATTSGSAFASYGNLVKDEILAELDRSKEIRGGSYSIRVRIWVASDGTVQRVALASSTGNRDRDRAIENALSQLRRISRSPPVGTPQPISLRVVSRL